MTDSHNPAIQYAQDHKQEFIDSLKRFLIIPSISTSPEHNEDMVMAANWVADHLRQLRFNNVQIFPTPGHPVVFAEYLANPSAPTVLIYGHYDVQPVDPIDLWTTPPFEPTLRGDNLYARGASDMKGQVVATLKAVESILSVGDLPVNIKFIIEGEEEIGSPNLKTFLVEHKGMLTSDFALNPDAGMISADVPTIVYGLRGLAYFELRIYGPDHDLHSGLFGGITHNPAVALCQILAGMHDDQGRITLPGFYDSVRALSSEEKLELNRLPMDEEYYKMKTGAPVLWGEAGYTPVERVGVRPTLDVNGLLSGFTGSGSKTVIPAWAMAKISMRLVPAQDPEEVHQQLRSYLEANSPKTIRWELTQMASGKACITDIKSEYTQSLYRALETVWGRAPLYKREGGSVPVVPDMQTILGVDSVLTGFGLPEDNIHSPNEKLHLPTWYRGIEALIHFIYNLEGINRG